MASFLEEVDRLRETFEGEKIPVLFLQLLGSVGKYIRNQKARAHPDSIRVLNSVYNSFEKVLIEEDMPEAEKRKWLYGGVNRFKKLKQDIARGRAEAIGPVPGAPGVLQEGVEEKALEPSTESHPTDLSAMPPHEAFAYALEEIKQVIKAEFQALRAELRLWRDSR
jgi:hypothetical protein